MKAGEELILRLKQLLMQPACVFPANVVSVDETALTCVVQTLNDDAPMSDVRLKAAIDNVTDGIVEIPVVGSTVLVCLIGNDENTAFVVKCSSVSKVVMFGGSKGGLINIGDLVSKINAIENKLNSVINTFNTHVHSGVTTGPGSSAVTPTTVAGTLTPTNRTDIEDVKVTH